jgi:uncharacterized phage protein (TIGR02218 family)
MKTFAAPYQTHLDSRLHTLATFITITRGDSQSFFFTLHDRDVTIGGDLYVAVGGLSFSADETSTGFAVDNSDVDLVIDNIGITDSDIVAGLFDSASVSVFETNYTDPNGQHNNIRTGTIGNYQNEGFVGGMETRGLMQHLRQVIGRLMMKKCGWQFGSTECTISIPTHTVTGTVTAVTNRLKFTGTIAPTFHDGLLTFTSGENIGISRDVRQLSALVITLLLPFPYDIAISDAYSVYAGCDFTPSRCLSYGNKINFGGFPFLPGQDQILDYPNQK